MTIQVNVFVNVCRVWSTVHKDWKLCDTLLGAKYGILSPYKQ